MQIAVRNSSTHVRQQGIKNERLTTFSQTSSRPRRINALSDGGD